MGPLAMLAFDAGHFVVGTDLQQSVMTDRLKANGALIHISKAEDTFIADQQKKAPIDWFIYSSALPKDHPEVLFAKENGIRTSKRDEFLNYLLLEKKLKLIAVSGTHGKTTTTGMLVWLFKQLGTPISYSIGTTISFGPAAQYKEGSEYFVYECDEFDRNFLHFSPFISAIPSLDYDHTDTYPTKNDYDQAFKAFITKSRGTVLWRSAVEQLQVSENEKLTILEPEENLLSEIKLPGDHTRRNAWLAISVMQQLFPELKTSQLIRHMNGFPGTNRRFEKLAENIYTDYAHHPAEIAATIQMAKEVNQNVVVVYQPHQNIRQHEILSEGGYKDSFNDAKKVYWLPTYLSREYTDLPLVPSEKLAESATNHESIEVTKMNTVLFKKVEEHAKNGDIVVAMSAGDLDTWLRENLG